MHIDELRQLEKKYFEANQMYDAMEVNTKILIKLPNDPRSLHNMGSCYFKLNEFEKAIDFFEKSLEEDFSSETFDMLKLAKKQLGRN